MTIHNIIVDASILIKFIKQTEQDSDKATQLVNDCLLGKYQAIQPNLWLYEIFNYLSRETPNKLVLKTLENLACCFIDSRTPTWQEWNIADRLMKKYKHQKIAGYDAIYHAFAFANKALFVTADEDYFTKTQTENNIKLLRDFIKIST